MGQIQFKNNRILFVEGKIAFHPDCCCDLPDCCWVNPLADFLEAKAYNVNPSVYPFATHTVTGQKVCDGCHTLTDDWWLLESTVPGGLATGCGPIDNFHLDPTFGGVGNILGYWVYDGYLCTFNDLMAPCTPPQTSPCCGPLDGFDVNVALQAIAYRWPIGSETGCRIALRQGNYNPPGTPHSICWYNSFGFDVLDIAPSLCNAHQANLTHQPTWSSPSGEDACQGCWRLNTNCGYLVMKAA